MVKTPQAGGNIIKSIRPQELSFTTEQQKAEPKEVLVEKQSPSKQHKADPEKALVKIPQAGGRATDQAKETAEVKTRETLVKDPQTGGDIADQAKTITESSTPEQQKAGGGVTNLANETTECSNQKK